MASTDGCVRERIAIDDLLAMVLLARAMDSLTRDRILIALAESGIAI